MRLLAACSCFNILRSIDVDQCTADQHCKGVRVLEPQTKNAGPQVHFGASIAPRKDDHESGAIDAILHMGDYAGTGML